MRLVISGDDGAAFEALLDQDEVVVGRAPEAQVRLNDRDVSRRHARLVREGARWFIEDLGSASGTRVDGTLLVGRRPLGLGESLQIGGYVLRLEPEAAELPTMPPSPSGPVVTPATTGTSRRSPLLTGGLAVLVVAALGGGGWAWKQRVVRLERCRTLQTALDQRDWTAGGELLHVLREAGQTCQGLDLAGIETDLERNRSAAQKLEEARRLVSERQFDGALDAVASAPKDSLYAEDLHRVEAEARRGQADALAAALEAALNAGQLDEAERLIEQLSRLGLDVRLIDLWRGRLAALKEAATAPAIVATEPPTPRPARPAPEEAPPSSRRPVGERDAEARRLYDAAGNDIRASDMLGAVDKLQRALDVDPSKNLRCQLLRSLGVAFSRSGKKVETARTYKAYLACDPKARDREQLERVIREATP